HQVFEPVDSMWRGFPRIRCSKMRLREPFSVFDSEVRYAEELKEIIDADFSEPEGCSCNKVLRGLMEPRECPLFGGVCTPQSPIGPCMVSMEGACNIEYRYRRIAKIS
ncbi:hydrogenase formation protein HypD, partial [Candidatus Bathyarchaeota archaeon]|nr:hydrogenase formation protein HypD [Candidatus Bathyarchaeota archaeon]